MNSEIKAALAKINKATKEDEDDRILIGSVVDVEYDKDSENHGTITIQPLDSGEPEIHFAKINALEGGNRGSFYYPKIGSHVLVNTFSNNGQAVVLMMSHIDTIERIIDKEIINVVEEINNSGTDSEFEKISTTGEKTFIKQSKDQISIGSDEANLEPMALGDKLGIFLSDFIDEVSKIKVATAIGTQPILNIAQVIAFKQRLEEFKSTICKLE